MQARLLAEGLPDTDPVLMERLQVAGYFAVPDEKRAYVHHLIRLLGGLEKLTFLRGDPFIRLFTHAQIRKGTIFSFEELKSLAQPQQQIESFREQFQNLVLKNLFFRGFSLGCPNCQLETWYELLNLAETVTCQGCASTLQLPVDRVEFSYKPNELLCKGLNNGVLTVLLTLSMLHSACQASFVWEAGLQVTFAGQPVDLDLLCIYDGQLMVIECKDNILDTVEAQLQKTNTIAEDIRAGSFFVSTLTPEIPSVLRAIPFLQTMDGNELRQGASHSLGTLP